MAVKGLTTSKTMSGLTQQQKPRGHRVLLFLCYVGLQWSSLLKDAGPSQNEKSTHFENFRLLLLKLNQALSSRSLSEAEVSLLKKRSELNEKTGALRRMSYLPKLTLEEIYFETVIPH